jgi:N6-L-threonylcarbamoyladenine synthase
MGREMKKSVILAIETSCDETSASLVIDGVVKSNVVWSQVKLHAAWGGVVPSIAKRAHQERIDGIVEQALKEAKVEKPDYVAVTVGPGLAIALEVGILKAKELALEWGVPLVKVNHLEGHVLASAPSRSFVPALALVVSGGHTELYLVKSMGEYEILARTADDALGEALDKAAKMMGLAYPGGPVIETKAKLGDKTAFELPIPLRGREKEGRFSYSGLKTALLRLIEKEKGEDENGLSEKQIRDLAASYQEACFEHLIRVVRVNSLPHLDGQVKDLLVGGGVIMNKKLQEKLEELGGELGITIHFPRERSFCGDNAGMIGLAAYQKVLKGEVIEKKDFDEVDRLPRWSLGK